MTPGSELENVAVALGDTVTPPGRPLMIAAVGAVASTLHEANTALTVPAALVDLIETEWFPSVKPVRDRGEEQLL